eukprot:2503106-Karenia_brevis.AAC.1
MERSYDRAARSTQRNAGGIRRSIPLQIGSGSEFVFRGTSAGGSAESTAQCYTGRINQGRRS